MTEPLFFDTDCISAFLWVNNESILSKLFPGRIVIPKEVYDELSHPGVNRVKGLSRFNAPGRECNNRVHYGGY